MTAGPAVHGEASASIPTMGVIPRGHASLDATHNRDPRPIDHEPVPPGVQDPPASTPAVGVAIGPKRQEVALAVPPPDTDGRTVNPLTGKLLDPAVGVRPVRETAPVVGCIAGEYPASMTEAYSDNPDRDLVALTEDSVSTDDPFGAGVCGRCGTESHRRVPVYWAEGESWCPECCRAGEPGGVLDRDGWPSGAPPVETIVHPVDRLPNAQRGAVAACRCRHFSSSHDATGRCLRSRCRCSGYTPAPDLAGVS